MQRMEPSQPERKETLWFFPTTANHRKLIGRIARLLEDHESYLCRTFDLKKYVRENYPIRVLWLILRKTGLTAMLGIPRDAPWSISLVCHQRRILPRLQQVLTAENAGCIILLDQYMSLAHAFCIALAAKMQVPVIVIPYVCHDIDVIRASRAGNREVSRYSRGVLGRLAVLLAKRWSFVRDNGRFLWADPISVFGIRRLGLRVEAPQRGVNDHVSSLLAASAEARSRLLSCGFSPERIQVVGDVAFDYFHREKQAGVLRRTALGLSPSAKTVLYSIVPDLKKKTVYGDYKDYLEAYAAQLNRFKESGWNVLCNPHPSTDENAVKLLAGYGFNIKLEDIATLLPHADLYLTSYSSTLTWSVALGIPAIDHDVYRQHYDDSRYAGIRSVTTPWELEELVRQIIAGGPQWEAWKGSAMKDAERPDSLDGHVVDRILERIRQDRNIAKARPGRPGLAYPLPSGTAGLGAGRSLPPSD